MDHPIVVSTQIWNRGYFTWQEDLLAKNDERHPYTILHCRTDAVAVLAQDPEGRWILNREYRHATGKWILGCPGGRLDEGEDAVQGGLRELLEETGFVPKKASLLGSSYPFPGVCSQQIHYVFASGAEQKAASQCDPLEFIKPVALTSKELLEEMQKGTPIDGILLGGLWLYEKNL
ncbi:MAG: NUDIX hydrolase [Verrucomicrobiota bacterium]|nr:NUDIX hydrolase [Verrucomicrobiota bacterium]